MDWQSSKDDRRNTSRAQILVQHTLRPRFTVSASFPTPTYQVSRSSGSATSAVTKFSLNHMAVLRSKHRGKVANAAAVAPAMPTSRG